MVEMVIINEQNSPELYMLTIDEEVVGEYDLLGQVSEAILSYFNTEVIKPITWDSEESFFRYDQSEIFVETNDNGKIGSLSNSEKSEITLYLEGDESLSDEEVKRLELINSRR